MVMLELTLIDSTLMVSLEAITTSSPLYRNIIWMSKGIISRLYIVIFKGEKKIMQKEISAWLKY